MRLIRINDEAFYAVDGLIAISDADIVVLKEAVHQTPRKRVRICTHSGVEAAHHEMFVCYTSETEVAPHKHVLNDETFCVLEGDMDFILYNESGDIRSITPMGAPGSGKPFSVRVPRDTYHTIKLNSDYCVLHVTNPGPYQRENTVWVKWSK